MIDYLKMLRAALAIVAALVLTVAACWAWSQARPALGERPLTPTRIWAARCGAVGFWSAAQAVLFAVALPAIYRRRAIYLGVAIIGGAAAILATVTAAALLAASAQRG